MKSRVYRAQINVIASFFCQILTLACGFIIPQLFIRFYGSEAYGMTSSITQFLSYITLLEGGVAGVARAALYKPLAINNVNVISSIIKEIQKFFNIIGCIFLIYTVLIAGSFKYISNVQCFDWLSTFLLVIVISISIIAQYFVGISYSILLQASQRQYITNAINIATMVVNTIIIIVLVNLEYNLIVVKLFSSIIFVFRPILMQVYVRRKFNIQKTETSEVDALKQKWTALGQHIAFFLHSNTDIAVLTIFSNLKLVAIYSVYNMVVYAIQNLATSFSAGMEAVFGDMIAKDENKLLDKTFGFYETMISMVSVLLFSTAAVLIVPFISIYTSGVTDANYIAPIFSLLLIISSLLYCLRLPYHYIVIASGSFKETRVAGYGEAAINIIISVILVTSLDLIGVAIGTVIAVSFRFIYYVVYISGNICHRKIALFTKRIFVNALSFMLIYILGNYIISFFALDNYYMWIIVGGGVGFIASLVTILINGIFYNNDIIPIIKKIACKYGLTAF